MVGHFSFQSFQGSVRGMRQPALSRYLSGTVINMGTKTGGFKEI
jgi:hypothetical protein